jgi:hypothetical protein
MLNGKHGVRAMNRAEQIQARLREIDELLAAEPPEVGESSPKWLDWLLDSMPPEERAALVEERRSLVREFEKLPRHIKEAANADWT